MIMPTNKYLDSLLIQVKKYGVPDWLSDDLLKVARASVGSKIGGEQIEKEIDDKPPESLDENQMFHVEHFKVFKKSEDIDKSIEEVWKSVSPLLPIAMGPKWNGLAAVLEKKGDTQRLWIKGCDDFDLFEKLPDLKKDFAKISGDYIIDLDLGIKKAGKRLPTADLMRLKSEEITLDPDEKIIATALDSPFIKTDISELPFRERKNRLKSLLQNASIKVSPDKFVNNRDQFNKAVQWAFGFDKSEGAVGKVATEKYDKKQDVPDQLEKSYEVAIAKINDEKQIASFIVTDPYEIDADGHWISPAEAEDFFYAWMENSRKIKYRHKKETPAVIVGGWLVPYPSEKDYMAAMENKPHRIYDMKLGNDRAKSGSPIVDIKVTVQGHEVWGQIKNGEINAVSIGGKGIMRPVPKSAMPQVTEVIKIG